MKNKSYIGCSGFSERLWKGFFYPEDLPARDYLQFYSKNLNALEINSTFIEGRPIKPLKSGTKRCLKISSISLKFQKTFEAFGSDHLAVFIHQKEELQEDKAGSQRNDRRRNSGRGRPRYHRKGRLKVVFYTFFLLDAKI